MLQSLKVFLLRWIYRFASWWIWRKHVPREDRNDLHLAASNTGLALRLFANGEGGEKPLIVYLHGGGWVIGDLETHTPFCQRLRDSSGCSVVSVDYRLAPEHPFPAAQEDCLSALAWIVAHPTKLGPNNGKIVLAGDSAGGNLAACLCIEAPDAARDRLHGAVLIYPVVDHYSAKTRSYEERATGHMLTRRLMHWFWDTYLGGYSADDPVVQRAMPLHASNLGAMPATFLVTAEFDPLRDEGIAFAEKLAAAGVAVTHHHYANAAHGFACSEGPTEDFRAFEAALCGWLGCLT